MIPLSCLGDGLGPIGMVECVGIELGLQGDAGAFAVVDAVLAVVIQEVSGIELDARAVGVDGHAPAGGRICQGGAGIAEDLEVVVISSLEVQGIVVDADIPANGLWGPEIHGSAADIPLFTCGDALGIVRAEMPGREGENLIHGFVRMLVACQVEVTVVGQVEDGVLIADPVVNNVQAVVAVYAIGDGDLGIAGHSLVPIRAGKDKGNGVFGLLFHGPQTLVVTVGPGVEVVASLIGGKSVAFAADGEGRSRNAVGAAANSSPQAAAAGLISLGCVVTQDHVRGAAGGIRHPEPDQGRAKVRYLGLNAASGDGVQGGTLVYVQIAEFFLHENAPFNFLFGTGKIMLRPHCVIVLYSPGIYNAIF